MVERVSEWAIECVFVCVLSAQGRFLSALSVSNDDSTSIRERRVFNFNFWLNFYCIKKLKKVMLLGILKFICCCCLKLSLCCVLFHFLLIWTGMKKNWSWSVLGLHCFLCQKCFFFEFLLFLYFGYCLVFTLLGIRGIVSFSMWESGWVLMSVKVY